MTPGLPLPRWVYLPAGLALALFVVPLAGLVARVPWASVPGLLGTAAAQDALWLSLRTCTASTLLAIGLGLPLALVLSRLPGRLAWLARTVAVLPMVLPPVVAGLLLLVTLGRRGLLGRHLAAFGIEIGFTSVAVVVAQTFVAMPFLVVAVESALRSADPGYAQVAATLGASPTHALRRVTLPLIAPALVGGTTMTFARSLGEFGATLTFAGSLQGTTRTLPLEIYLARESDPDAALALSLLLIALAALLMALPLAVQRGLAVRRAGVAASAVPAASAPVAAGRRPPAAGRVGASPSHVAGRIGARGFEADLTLSAGRTTAVVGPNGAGKSTLLGLVSGLVRADAAAAHVPPHRRDVALLTQRPLLFPHLAVLDNVAFGVRARGASRADAAARALAELDAVGATDLAGRRPDQLSGGQQQRVALARALATDPGVLLLDEPLASLDVEAAAALRALLAERLEGRTVALVTHDPLDLWMLAHDVVVIEAGRVVAHGPLDAVLERPATPFVAELAGTNRLVGTASDPDRVVLADGTTAAGVPDPDAAPLPGRPALALFEPAAVGLHRDAPGGSPRNAWPVEVVGVEPRGALVRVRLALDGQHLAADVTPRSVVELGLVPGARVFAAVKAAQVRCVRGAHAG